MSGPILQPSPTVAELVEMPQLIVNRLPTLILVLLSLICRSIRARKSCRQTRLYTRDWLRPLPQRRKLLAEDRTLRSGFDYGRRPKSNSTRSSSIKRINLCGAGRPCLLVW